MGGTGELGFGLGLRLGQAGVRVVFGSREADRARDVARSASALVPDGVFAGDENRDAVEQALIVFLCVPLTAQVPTLRSLEPHLNEGAVLVDATVPLAAGVGGRPTEPLTLWSGSAAEQARSVLPARVGVCSALHTISGGALAAVEHAVHEDCFLCGDSEADKLRVKAILERIEGLRCVDVGSLERARLLERLTPLLIGINRKHKTQVGLRVTGLTSRESENGGVAKMITEVSSRGTPG